MMNGAQIKGDNVESGKKDQDGISNNNFLIEIFSSWALTLQTSWKTTGNDQWLKFVVKRCGCRIHPQPALKRFFAFLDKYNVAFEWNIVGKSADLDLF